MSGVEGEWLVPKGGALVLSLGAHSIEGGVRERVVVIEASPSQPAAGASVTGEPCPVGRSALPVNRVKTVPDGVTVVDPGDVLYEVLRPISPLAVKAAAAYWAASAGPGDTLVLLGRTIPGPAGARADGAVERIAFELHRPAHLALGQ